MTDVTQLGEEEQRDAVVAEARTWLRTPYIDQARIKGAGADCTFIAEVYSAVGLIPKVNVPFYSPQQHLSQTNAIYRDTVLRYARPVETPRRGDIVLYAFGLGPTLAHGAIAIQEPWPGEIIHADVGVRWILIGHGDHGRLGLVAKRFFTLWPRR